MERSLFIRSSTRYLDDYLQRIRRCAELLDEDQIWWRPNARSNSVGNLILHLCGNVSQWVLEGVGGEPYERRRSLEFSADRTQGKAVLLQRLGEVVSRARRVIEGLTDADLATPHSIQGYATDGLRAVFHAVEHMSYHTGQIVFITKQLVDDRVEIEFYPQHKGE